jgi:hypothetical protein
VSRSLRTIPAGALAAFAVVLLASPQAEAAADRAGRPAAGTPRPAVSAHPRPARAHDEATAPGAAEGHLLHGWGTDSHADRGRHHRTDVRADSDTQVDGDDGATAPTARPHGVPGESSPAPSGAPGGSTDDRRDGDRPTHGDGSRDAGPQAVDGPAWPAPVAPPSDPLLHSGVWRPAGPGRLQAPAQAGPSVDRAAATMPDAPVLPVLTFGAGLTSLGLGIAFFAVRMRRG